MEIKRSGSTPKESNNVVAVDFFFYKYIMLSALITKQLILLNMKRMIFLMLTLLIWSAASMNAQVIIGDNSKEPHPGAILDLSPLQNLGLLLPGVELQNTTTLQVGGSVAETDENATGMLVYNKTAKVTPSIPKGIYVWNGTDWIPAVLIPN
jgi:hypothetical protein